jgi:hypothetical protein
MVPLARSQSTAFARRPLDLDVELPADQRDLAIIPRGIERGLLGGGNLLHLDHPQPQVALVVYPDGRPTDAGDAQAAALTDAQPDTQIVGIPPG